MLPPISIGQLAKRTGVGVETVRYYEKIGLLPAPSRTPGNYRSYGSDAVQRLGFVRRARDLGFPSTKFAPCSTCPTTDIARAGKWTKSLRRSSTP